MGIMRNSWAGKSQYKILQILINPINRLELKIMTTI